MCVLFSIKTVRSTEEDLGHFSEFFFPEFFTFFETRSVNLYVRSFEFGPGGEKCKFGGEKFKSGGEKSESGEQSLNYEGKKVRI